MNLRKVLWVTSFLCLIIYANVTVSIGPILPQISKDFAITLDMLGFILAVSSLGGSIAILGGWISDRMSRLLVAAVSVMVLAAGSSILGFSPNPLVLGTSLLLMGMSAGFLESSLNALVSTLYSERRGLSVNLFHIGWNIGSTIGPSLAVFLVNTTGSWRNVYIFPLPILFSISALMIALNKNYAQIRDVRRSSLLSISSRSLLRFFPITLIGFFYTGVEMGVSTWLALILEDLGSGIFKAGLATGLFWGLMGLGRLVWAPVIDRMGYERPLIMASGSGLICMALASLPLPLDSKIVFWASSGFFLAPTFPTLIAWVISSAPELGGSVSGLLFAVGRLGLFFSNCIVGLTATILGTEIAQYLFVLFMVAMLVNILAVHLFRRES